MSGWLATVDEALDVAREHWEWASAHGHTPALIVLGLGDPKKSAFS